MPVESATDREEHLPTLANDVFEVLIPMPSYDRQGKKRVKGLKT